MIRFIVRTTPSPARRSTVNKLRKAVPHAEWLIDPNYFDPQLSGKQKAMLNFLDAMRLAGDDPCVHMEDDALPCAGFLAKIEAAIAERPTSVIQFFSRRDKDLTVGSRWDTYFSFNVCYYMPPGYSRAVADFYPDWPRKEEHPGGYDILQDDWLKMRREAHWIHVPSLVQHVEGRSMIDPRRNSRRLSATFEGSAT